ncbi:hypothetical protein HNQ34_001972 [Anoxybacillus tepidamans]|uniref:Uncharacterized protein n=1 Tax=Anoxybacteroides tepidamans TaxID=265948 RepID=A0A7W8IQS4_9BACL|nr:hypothetical protein [Anoxybacillus tepidamans]MBB5324874.1 hypothetical protein [Anoxybacillus tepidamans]
MPKQTKKQRKDTVFGAVSGLVFLCGFSIWWQFHLSFYFLIAVIFMSVALGAKAASYVPDMRKKENKNKNPYTGLPQKKSMKKTDKLPSSRQRTAEATPSSSSDRARKYNIRSDDMILQLPVFANIKLSHFARKNVSHSISSENTVLIWSERHDRLVAYRNTLMCRLSSEIMPLEATCQDAPDLPFVNF